MKPPGRKRKWMEGPGYEREAESLRPGPCILRGKEALRVRSRACGGDAGAAEPSLGRVRLCSKQRGGSPGELG